MRLELTHVGLLVELANHYTTRGALDREVMILFEMNDNSFLSNSNLYLQIKRVYIKFYWLTLIQIKLEGCLYRVVADLLDCSIIVSEFELQ